MNTQKKFWLVLIGAFLALVIIACSCGSLVPTRSVAPPAGPSMAGKWLDPDTSGTITTIVAKSGGFEAVSVINPERGGNELTKSSWSKGVLTWTYCIPNGGNCITSVTVSVSDTSLETTWTDDRGYSGTTAFERQP